MNTKRIVRWGVVLFLLAALPGLTAALAQGEEPAVVERGESTSVIPWANSEYESNDTMNSANYFEIEGANIVLGGTIGSAEDVDFWELAWLPGDRFEGYGQPDDDHLSVLMDIDAQTFGSPVNTAICLYADDGVFLSCSNDSDGNDSMMYFTFERDRSYYLRVTDVTGHGGSDYRYQILVSSPLLISAAAANLGTGYVDGIPFQSGDILAHSDFNVGGTVYQKWVMFFDLSDLGVKGNLTNLTGGWRNSNYLLIGFASNVALPGIVGKVTPWEVVAFEPLTLGPNTSGTFSRWWDGRLHQLAASGEKLDAVEWPDWAGYTRLMVSTTGGASVYGGPSRPRLKLADEDAGLWKDDPAAGQHWASAFDGTNWGIDRKDIVALAYNEHWMAWEGDIYSDYYDFNATLLGNATVGNNVSVSQKDIVRFRHEFFSNWDGDYDYYSASILWHGPDHGWNYNIDAIDVCTKW